MGQVRATGTWILLFIVTLGIAGLVWFFKVFEEMKQHTGTGLGGGLGLLISLLGVGAFVSAYEVGQMYQRAGQAPPVSGWTGCWLFVPFVGGIIWFVKVNGALNDYWRSLGAV
ncbi:DUF4234 domain-containing protein [Phytoactinopolyspora halotolerans]|uniref:DUF4234 domain-containing protein n=1 Tax=Phytoactinopolyspora halotolerans TaxID=1981512 RepID=A0A6L9S3L7_9ACTN|nr:DUF4234 domain-containing protein [Phytoactinopolyspora halotolerans]